MQHIVQFAVGIDDEAITNLVTKNAEKEIIRDLKQSVANKLFSPRYYNGNADPKTDNFSNFSLEIIDVFLKENKDAIINRAAEKLADKLAKSKKGKEILQNITGEV